MRSFGADGKGKFTSLANSLAMMAADGTSIIISDRDFPAEFDSLIFQLFHDVIEDHLGLAEFHEGADHGEHDADVAEGGGPA